MKYMLHNRIEQYLQKNNWDTNIISNQLVASPPSDLGFREGFKLIFTTSTDKNDYEEYNKSALNLIAEIYEISVEDLFTSLNHNSEILSFKIHNNSTLHGDVSLGVYQESIENIKDLLVSTAAFTIEEKPQILQYPEEAETYLSLCRFLQTRKGSFETRILLPTNIEIRQAGLLGPSVMANDINMKLIKILEFTLSSIGTEISEEYLIANRSYINIDASMSLYKIYSSLPESDLSFKITSAFDKYPAVNFLDINISKIKRFDDLNNSIRSKLEEKQYDVDLEGFITKLETRDVNLDNNTIQLLAIDRNLGPIKIRIKLEEDEYIKALSAQANKRNVAFKGNVQKLKRYKSTYKALSIESISYID